MPKVKKPRKKKMKRNPPIRKVPMKGVGRFLFETELESGHRVHVTTNGVTIWDGSDGRWVIDASTIANDNEFAIASELFKRGTSVPLSINPEFPGSFLRYRRKSK